MSDNFLQEYRIRNLQEQIAKTQKENAELVKKLHSDGKAALVGNEEGIYWEFPDGRRIYL